MSPLFLLQPLANTAFQVLMKLAAQQTFPYIIFAVMIEGVAFYLWMQILAKHDLGRASLFSAISYIFIISTGWIVFHEKIMALQIIGSALIMGGVWLIGTSNKAQK